MQASAEADAAVPTSGRRDDVIVLAILSLAAGFLHGAVVDAHRGHGIASQVFFGVALFQIVWAGLVLGRPTRLVLLAGAAANLIFVLAWVASRTVGIEFIDGFQEVEDVGLTDMVTVLLEGLLVAGAAVLAFAPDRRLLPVAGALRAAGLGGLGLAVALLGVPAAAAVNDHADSEGHEDAAEVAAGHENGDGEHADSEHADGHDEQGAVHEHGDDEPQGPIPSVTDDLRVAGGDSSVTTEQRAAAEKLLRDTVSGLWQWTDPDKVYAAGFRSINDGVTGTEHLVNWNWIQDDVVLDPNHPESLVYRVTPNGRVLEAAMYMAPAGTPDSEVPDVGGTLTQWHIHNNLCYSPVQMVDGFPQRTVVGITGDGRCIGGEFLSPHAPMLHVWVVPHQCGPFASLEGIGAGQAITEKQDPNAAPECQHSVHQ